MDWNVKCGFCWFPLFPSFVLCSCPSLFIVSVFIVDIGPTMLPMTLLGKHRPSDYPFSWPTNVFLLVENWVLDPQPYLLMIRSCRCCEFQDEMGCRMFTVISGAKCIWQFEWSWWWWPLWWLWEWWSDQVQLQLRLGYVNQQGKKLVMSDEYF